MPVDNRVEPLWDLSFGPAWAVVVIGIAFLIASFATLYLTICGNTALRCWRGGAAALGDAIGDRWDARVKQTEPSGIGR